MFDDNNESATHAYEEFTRIFSREVIKMEGSPASTTGVGMKLVEIIEKLEDAQQVKLARQIKAAFDPSKLLNPGKKLSK
jgi:FAD/FMN-containing dehydrogenase